MILHGDGSANVFIKDGLLPFNHYKNLLGENTLDSRYYDKSVNGKFDVIITNPPFSVDLDNDTKKSVKRDFIFGGKKNSENLFIERYYQLLKPKGRAGIVLPESVFDTSENKYIRIFIYKYFKIKAVISLPQLTFQPFTSTKTSLLLVQKKTFEEIMEWDTLWTKYTNEWNLLKTRVINLIDVYTKKKDRSKLSTISDLTLKDELDILTKILRSQFDVADIQLSPSEIIFKYLDDLTELSKYDKDTKDVFGFVNTWWVFGEVSKHINYSILMSEVDNVGYKRSKRGEKLMPNDLYRVDEAGSILVDDGIRTTVLDELREIVWD